MNNHLAMLIPVNLILISLCFKIVFGSLRNLKLNTQCLVMPYTEGINSHWGNNLNAPHKFMVVLAFMLITGCVEIFMYY